MKKVALYSLALLGLCAGWRTKPAEMAVAPQQDSMAMPTLHTKNDTAKVAAVDDLILTDEFEWFDQERFDQRPDKDSNSWGMFLPNGTYVRLMDNAIGSESKEGKKYYKIIPKDSYFGLYKAYYPSGRIRSKGWAFTDFFEKGVWYEFDEGGNLIAKNDYDKPFTYTFEDVLRFCQRNNIKVSKSTGEWVYGFRTKIKRAADAAGDICGWRIEYLKRDDLIEYIFLDGKTGEITGRKTMDYSPG